MNGRVTMIKKWTVSFALKHAVFIGAGIFLSACGGQADDRKAESGRILPPPGMHVYKDPQTGEFIAQPAVEQAAEQASVRVQAPSRQQANHADDGREAEQAQEYEAPVVGGGVLMDLPAPYSEPQE